MAVNVEDGAVVSDDPITIFEDFTGIAIGDLLRTSRNHEKAQDALLSMDLGALADRLAALDSSRQASVYPASALVPRLYDVVTNHRLRFLTGTLPPRVQASEAHMWSALLYAHRVEVNDPLPSAVRYAAYTRRSDSGIKQVVRQLILFRAIAFWQDWRKLIDDGVIALARPTTYNSRKYDELFAQACEAPEFRDALLSVDPDLARRWNARSSAQDNPMSQTKPGAGFHAALRDDDDIEGNRWADYNADLRRALDGWAGSHADLWFPTVQHLRIFGAWCAAAGAGHDTPTIDHLPVRLAEVPIADLSSLNANDLKAMRLYSDVFERWREGVRAAYNYLDSRLSVGVDLASARVGAAEVLEAHAQQLLAGLRRDAAKVWSGALRGFVLGLFGSAPAAVSQGPHELGIAVLGGLSGLAAGLAWDRIATRDEHQAARAVRRHIVALNGPPSAEIQNP